MGRCEEVTSANSLGAVPAASCKDTAIQNLLRAVSAIRCTDAAAANFWELFLWLAVKT